MAKNIEGIRVGLLHTTIFAVQPMIDEFRRQFPEAEIVHFLDEGFLPMLGQYGGASKQVSTKALSVAKAAEEAGVKGIQCSCSSLSPAISNIQPFMLVPTNDIDSAMAEAAVAHARSIALLATGSGVHKSMMLTFQKVAARLGKQPTLKPVLANTGGVRRGDPGFFEVLAKEVYAAAGQADVVAVGQVSMVGCMAFVGDDIKDRVFTGPPHAVAAIKSMIGSGQP
ncbi:MAG: hypothetical protein Q8P50_09005 [Bacillota bacterium]|nr:hypothetical protein [Bacillota bacterium]